MSLGEKYLSEFFCVRPWNHLQVKNNGALRFCCEANSAHLKEKGQVLFAPTSSFESIDASENLNEIKRKFLTGAKPTECQKCWNTESSGGRSLRQKINSAWKIDEALNGLQSIELRLGNTCNLKCRMCGPQNSSSWYSDYKVLNGNTLVTDDHFEFDYSHKQQAFSWHHNSDETYNWLFSVAPGLKEIQFSGGEPLLTSSHLPLLRRLVKEKKAADLYIRYATNATVLSENFFSLWKNFKEVTLSVSVDGTGSTFEYIRKPANWSELRRNLYLLDSEIGNSIKKVSIQPTANIFNTYNLIELAELILSEFSSITWTDHLNFQEHPNWQSMCILPDVDRQSLSLEYSRFAESLQVKTSLEPGSLRRNAISRWFQDLSKRILGSDLSHLRKTFLIQNSALDRLRDQSLETAIPEVYNRTKFTD